jgi:hypothetical protein
MTTSQTSKFKGHAAAWIALPLLALFALAMVIVPVWVIQPFKSQSVRGLELSYAMRRWSPLVTVFALMAAVAMVIWLWRGSGRWWRKALLIIILLPLFPATWFARQNHFEWMFNPLRNAAYARPSATTFITDSDMVLAVENGGEAVAYPVRLMAYHHVVQDTVGGTPIVATY